MQNTMLSPRQRQLCDTIERLSAARGFPPSLSEIAAEMRIDTSRASQLAHTAAAKGALHHEPRVARSWRVVKQATPAPAKARR